MPPPGPLARGLRPACNGDDDDDGEETRREARRRPATSPSFSGLVRLFRARVVALVALGGGGDIVGDIIPEG